MLSGKLSLFVLCGLSALVQAKPDDLQAAASDSGFRYAVNDFNGNEQSHQQQQTGNDMRGQYKVLLPDGRLQTVTYVADERGYRAKVDYTPALPGEATTAGAGLPVAAGSGYSGAVAPGGGIAVPIAPVNSYGAQLTAPGYGTGYGGVADYGAFGGYGATGYGGAAGYGGYGGAAGYGGNAGYGGASSYGNVGYGGVADYGASGYGAGGYFSSSPIYGNNYNPIGYSVSTPTYNSYGYSTPVSTVSSYNNIYGIY